MEYGVIDPGNTPVIAFDDFDLTIIRDMAWFTLYQTRPACGCGSECERVVVARTCAPLNLALGMIERAAAQTGRPIPMVRLAS